jgi:plasmid maintenance system antidote protein VapI
MKRKIAPVTPSEMLEEEFLKPLRLTMHRLAEDVGVSP